MPIVKQLFLDNMEVMIWKYEEGEIDREIDFNEQKKSIHRQIEKQVIREMLSEKLPFHHLNYYENGEPYLIPQDKNISISHSFPFAVLAISEEKIGVDIEKPKEKIEKIRLKFLHQSEIHWLENKKNELEYLTIIWCIKEALYKISSKKEWSFKDFYKVQEFDIEANNEIDCAILVNGKWEDYQALKYRIEDYWLVICLKK